MMLEGLDKIPWYALSHAYGTAEEDIPAMLQSLASGQMTQEEWHDFWNLIHHQGSIYPATTFVVPFLREMIESGVQDEKMVCNVLSLFGSIAQEAVFDEKDSDGSWEAAQHRLMLRSAHRAVGEGVPVYLRLLEASNAEIRAEAAFILSQFPWVNETTAPVIWEALQQETDPDVEAQLLLSLDALLYQAPQFKQRIQDALSAIHEPIVRFAAAKALTRRGLISPELMGCLPSLAETDLGCWRSPLFGRYKWSAYREIFSMFFQADSVSARNFVCQLAQRFSGSALEVPRLNEALLPLFPLRYGGQESAEALKLTTAQQNVLTVIAANDAFWSGSTPAILLHLTRRYHLAETQDALKDFFAASEVR